MAKAAQPTKQQSTQKFSLISGGKKFQIKKSLLFEKSSLFQTDPSLLNTSEYRVRTDAPPEAFAAFLGFLEGTSKGVVSETVDSLRGLAAEFGFEELRRECERFEDRSGTECGGRVSLDLSIFERLLKMEEFERVFERRLSFVKREVNRLSGSLSSALSRIESHLRLFESEQRYRRGCEYLFGTNDFGYQGEELSKTLGISMLKKSADLGHTDAQYRLGNCLLFGRGCGQDDQEGARYLGLSANGGNSFAESRFAFCLRTGRGVAKDEVLGFEFAKRSATAGNSSGQSELGVCLQYGSGTAKDLQAAFESYKRSMEQGSSRGQNNYSVCLVNGIGTVANPVAGAAIAKLAADQGHPTAQCSYAFYLEHGTGVVQDRAQAAEYYRRAMEGGHPNGKEGYDRCRQ
jgi:TPR repeat protein